MANGFQYDLFLSHSAKNKAAVCLSFLSASNGEGVGVMCRSLQSAGRLRQDGQLGEHVAHGTLAGRS